MAEWRIFSLATRNLAIQGGHVIPADGGFFGGLMGGSLRTKFAQVGLVPL